MSKRQIIGEGERATFKLLKKHYGEQTFILTQVPLTDLLNDEFRESLSERQKKETIEKPTFLEYKYALDMCMDKLDEYKMRLHLDYYLGKSDVKPPVAGMYS